LAAADLFATASITEVHPLTVIEAMAAGLPVAGVSSPGIVDTVEHGRTGFLSSRPAGLSAALVALPPAIPAAGDGQGSACGERSLRH
jgi:1,2-diacylglycerol 3-alpha-glucosyltransferase